MAGRDPANQPASVCEPNGSLRCLLFCWRDVIRSADARLPDGRLRAAHGEERTCVDSIPNGSAGGFHQMVEARALDGKINRHACAGSERALELHFAVMGFCKTFDDSKTEARAAIRGRDVVPCPAEPLEDVGLIVG